MKFLCTRCERLVELADFRFESGVLSARCDKCGEESQARPAQAELPRAVNAPARAPGNVVPLRPAPPVDAADFTTVPAGFCPKCIARRDGAALSCPHCGLVFANFQQEELALSAELTAAWRELLPQWGASERHDALLALAVKTGELAAAGRLYRIRLVRDPGDALAQRGRDEVVRLALLPSFRESGPDAGKRREKGKVIALAVLLVFTAGCFVLLLRQFFAE